MGREGWHAAPYLPDRFFDFEEPLDDFLGFFIRWYFRASSLSGAAAFPGAGGCVLEGTIGEAQVSSQMRELWRRSWRKPSSCPGEDTCLPAAPGRKSPSGELLQWEAICRATRDLGEGERQALMVNPSSGPKLGKAAWRRKQLPCLKFLDHHSQDL